LPALVTRFERTGHPADLDQAINAFREVLAATSFDHPNRPLWLSNLGFALRTRFEHTNEQTDLDQTIAAFMDAVGVESGPPKVRMRAARV
jgi:hypothetical protein